MPSPPATDFFIDVEGSRKYVAGLNETLQDVYSWLTRIEGGMIGLSNRVGQVPSGRFPGDVTRVDYKVVQETISGSEYGVLYVWVPAGVVSQVKVRGKTGGNLDDTISFSTLSLQSSPSISEWSGDYYRYQLALDPKSTSQLEWVALNADGEPIEHHVHELDWDRLPEFRQGFPDVFLGAFDFANTRWPVFFNYMLDEDGASGSVEWGTSATVFANPDLDGNFSSSNNGQSGYGISLGNVDADDDLFIVFRGRSGTGATGTKGPAVQVKITGPSSVLLANPNIVTSDYLALSTQKYNTNIVFSPDATDIRRKLNWAAGTINYNDGTSYSVNAGSKTMTVSGIHYLWFDPDVDANDIQVSTDWEDVLEVDGVRSSPKRLFLGMMERGADANFYLWFVTSAGPPIISAPLVFFGRLTGLFGQIKVLEIEDTLTIITGGEFVDSLVNFRVDEDGFAVIARATGAPNKFTIRNDLDTTDRFNLYHNDSTGKTFLENASGAGDLELSSNAAIVLLCLAGNEDITISATQDIILDAGVGDEVKVIDGDFAVRYGATAAFFVDESNDRTGFKTETPAYDVDVNGTLRVVTQLRVDGTVVSDALLVFDSTASGSYTPSFDRRIKVTVDNGAGGTEDVYLYGVVAP